MKNENNSLEIKAKKKRRGTTQKFSSQHGNSFHSTFTVEKCKIHRKLFPFISKSFSYWQILQFPLFRVELISLYFYFYSGLVYSVHGNKTQYSTHHQYSMHYEYNDLRNYRNNNNTDIECLRREKKEEKLIATRNDDIQPITDNDIV